MPPRIAHIDASGVLETTEPADATHPWWSLTKSAIAGCVLQLVSRGDLSLDAPLDTPHGSGSHGNRPHDKGRYTLRQLLQHRAGLGDYGALAAYHAAVAADEEPWAEDRLLDAVEAARPAVAAGECFSYSNVGYLHVRRLLERVTGEEFGELVQRLLCAPLGLDSVRLARTRDDVADTARASRAPYHPGWVYHGLLIGSVADACRLLHGLTTGAVLDEHAHAAMTHALPVGGAIDGRPWRRTGYGLGLMIGAMHERMHGTHEAVGHSGVGPGSVCAVYRFPRLANPCTVAVFADEPTEGGAEWRALETAVALQSGRPRRTP